MLMLRAAKTFSIAVILCSFSSSSTSSSSSGETPCKTESCMAEEEDAVTAFVQIKRSVSLGKERPGGKLQDRIEDAEAPARKVMEPQSNFQADKQGESQKQSQLVTFVGKVAGKQWYVWFRKKPEGKPIEPVKPKRVEVDDKSDLFALNADGLAVASGTDDQKAKGWWSNCLELTWDIGDCKWHAWVDGWKWRHAAWDWGCPGIGLHIPGCRPMDWMSMYEVAAMLPVNKVDPNTELAPTHEEMAAMNELIEKQMKAANYTVRDTQAPRELEAPQRLEATSVKDDNDDDNESNASSKN